MTHAELLLQGNFLGLIRAEVFVVAGLRLEWLGADFYVRVTIDLSGINKVRKCAYQTGPNVNFGGKTVPRYSTSKVNLNVC